MMKVTKIKKDPKQPRQTFDSESLAELGESLLVHGFINPVEVTKDGVIVTGERRLRAAEKVGMKEIPVRIIDLPEKELRIRQLHENILRKDLTSYEMAVFCRRYIDESGKEVKEVAEELGMSPQNLHIYLSVLNLPKETQRVVKNTTMKHLRSIGRLKFVTKRGEITEKQMTALITKLMKEKVSSDIFAMVSEAVNANPSEIGRILKTDFKGKSWQQVKAQLDEFAPSVVAQSLSLNRKIVDFVRQVSAIQQFLRVFKPSDFKNSSHSDMKSLIQDLQKTVDKWLK